jgi:hypothetical protein
MGKLVEGLVQLVSLVAAVLGWLFVNQVTAGVALLMTAIWLALLVGLSSSERQHRKTLAELQSIAAALSNGGAAGDGGQAAEFERQRRVLEAMEKPDRRYP